MGAGTGARSYGGGSRGGRGGRPPRRPGGGGGGGGGRAGGGGGGAPGGRPAQVEGPPRRRGGGPKTERGKAVVRRTPIKHAVLAQTPVIPLVEREEDWRRLREGVFDYFGAAGAMEEALADRI